MFGRFMFLFGLISFGTCLGQTVNNTNIDTSNIAYRTHLKELYAIRTAQTLSSFKNIRDKNFSKAVTELYTELNSEFIEKVDAGLFVQSRFYDDQINMLFKQIVDANPDYKSLASAHVLLSFADTPNASAIGDGFVVLNLPLLANLNDELELAFIIAHELAHDLLNHPQNGLFEYTKINISPEIRKQAREIAKKKYNSAKEASSLYRQIVYSNRKKHREIEFQADSLGFILFRNAFEGKEPAALKSFATLKHIDAEKDSLQPKDYEKLFASAKQPFKAEWMSESEISGYKYDTTLKFWQIDSLKTHPDCDSRAHRLQTLFNVKPENQHASDTNYRRVAVNSRHDHILGLYVLQQYGQSLYEALLLLKDSPQDVYLRNMAHRNLIRIREAQKNYTMNKYVETVSPHYSFSYNRFLSFLRQLRKAELSEIINQYSI